MTEDQIEMKNNIVDYAMENGVNHLSSFEIDFVEKLDNLADKVTLSDKENTIMIEIAGKLGI